MRTNIATTKHTYTAVFERAKDGLPAPAEGPPRGVLLNRDCRDCPRDHNRALEVGEKLTERGTKRSKAYLAGEAIAAFVERNGWQVARIKAALEEAQSGRPGVPHEEVEKWMDSWDTDHELPRPTPGP